MRRIRYIPGLISLALMLPLGLWFMKSQRAFKQERCVQMFFPYPKGQFSWFDSLWVRPDKAIVQERFSCSGSIANSSGELQAFKSKLEELAAAKDTSTWISMHFNRDSKYETVMHVWESCRLNTDVWWFEGDTLLTRYYRRPPRDEARGSTVYLDCLLCDDVVPMPKKRPLISALRTSLFEPAIRLARPVWPAIPLFLLLAWIGLRRAVRDSGSSPE